MLLRRRRHPRGRFSLVQFPALTFVTVGLLCMLCLLVVWTLYRCCVMWLCLAYVENILLKSEDVVCAARWEVVERRNQSVRAGERQRGANGCCLPGASDPLSSNLHPWTARELIF